MHNKILHLAVSIFVDIGIPRKIVSACSDQVQGLACTHIPNLVTCRICRRCNLMRSAKKTLF